MRSAFSLALHVHQPIIPASPNGAPISNLQYMFEHQGEGDNHNAGVFKYCYERMGDIVPQLVNEGKAPRVMLDYSGNLFWAFENMNFQDTLGKLRNLAHNYQNEVEWLGTAWGHAVAPSTPPGDYRLHVKAWKEHFKHLFGEEALSRVQGFSPSEMALPNHPDIAYEFVKTLREEGFSWVLIQEHTVELPDGSGLKERYLPHQLICKNTKGEMASIIALIKTQGSDTKLVAQMQPYYEAQTLGTKKISINNESQPQISGDNRMDSRGAAIKGEASNSPFEGGVGGGERGARGGSFIEIPQVAAQIADGENGGVMMNEFPGKYMEAVRELGNGQGDVRLMNGTEYLAYLRELGVKATDLPVCQPLHQAAFWNKFNKAAGETSPNNISNNDNSRSEAPAPQKDLVALTILECKKADYRFNMEGGSWTNDRSWVSGYDGLLGDMEKASIAFNQKFGENPPNNPLENQALFNLLCAQTSCFRYWGEGVWPQWGREFCQRAINLSK